jgi:predicted dehydrogenase
MSILRVGIIGCGSIAEHRHAPEYAANPHAEIVAWYDPNRKRADLLARTFGGRVADAYTEITRDPAVDAISDCSPNDMHEVITTDALAHGKHALCEKPMAVTVEGAQRMIEAARRSGGIFVVAYNQRLAAAHQKAREILAGGELGRVLTFQTTFGHRGPEHWSEARSKATWFFDRQRSVFGAAGDLGIHKVDLLRYLLDDEIVEVTCFAGTLHKTLGDGSPIGVNDNLVALLRTRKGCMGTLAASWTYYGPEDNSTTLYCERGIMHIYDDPRYHLRVAYPGGQETLYRLEGMQTNTAQTNSGVIDAFVDCIVHKRPPIVSGEDGLKSLRVILAMLESAEKRVTLAVNTQL